MNIALSGEPPFNRNVPKPKLSLEQQQLERDLISTMIAGLQEWRPDLDYPESYSDMQGCARAVIRMFDIKRASLANELKFEE
jgi:hypothetical protein